MAFRILSVSLSRALASATAVGCLCGAGWAQQKPSSSSSSNPEGPSQQAQQAAQTARPRVAQIEPGGASVTLEVSEPLFQMAAALNACGYDTDLAKSPPVRAEVREEINKALMASEPARQSRDALCDYVRLHKLNDSGADIGQYVSLSLYLSPAPELTPNVDESELPPQAEQVVNVLPLLRDFAEQVQLHYLWIHHRPEYEELQARVRGPMAKMILDTNIYLHQPVSSYDGRRFLVLLEPMISSSLTNARIYGADYIIVTSPDNTPAVLPDGSAGDPVRMDEIRHIYLHYVVEPMVYSRGGAMERLQPLLHSVEDAPLEFFYRNDVQALLSECLIKAIEARLYTIAAPKPVKPRGTQAREELARYDAAIANYNQQTALEQSRVVNRDESEGWVLTSYFYDQLLRMEKTGDGLRDEIAQMIYGMDVDREKHHAEQVQFVKTAPADPLRPTIQKHVVAGMDLAEMDLMQGKVDAAEDIAEKAMEDAGGDHARAQYMLARIDLMKGNAERAVTEFESAIKLSKDPRTQAWSHIYLGRLYDISNPPDRERAVSEYKIALTVRDANPDTRKAAETGIKTPYALPPGVKRPSNDDDDKDFDPTGKKQKEAYKPDPPK